MTASPKFTAQPALPPSCGHCNRMPPLCVCALMQPQTTRHRVLVLQHPQEQDRTLGSVPLLTQGLRHCDVHVGLSWRNLADALGEERAPLRPWAVLYPASLPKAGRAAAAAIRTGDRIHGAYLMNAKGRVLPAWPALGGIIVLDGTWSQAKALWWRNPWLLKLPRLGFCAPPQNIYGRVRREPKPGYMSTLEATAAALEALGEDADLAAALRKTFRTLVQRLRDDHKRQEAQAPRRHQRARNCEGALGSDASDPSQLGAPPSASQGSAVGSTMPSMNDETQAL